MNGIGDYAHRPDLLERSALVSLPAMPVGSRKTEEEIWRELELMLPGFLGRLFDVLGIAFRDELITEAPRDIRMADAARWLKAAEPATGLPKGALLAAIEESQTLSVVDRIRENSLFIALEVILKENGSFDGGVGALHNLLMLRFDRPDRSFPKTASHLSTQLQRLRPAMEKAGIIVELRHKGREGRTVSIRQAVEDKRPKKKGPYAPPY